MTVTTSINKSWKFWFLRSNSEKKKKEVMESQSFYL